MAIVHGTCGAWKDIRSALASDLSHCDTPAQFIAQFEKLDDSQSSWREVESRALNREIERLQIELKKYDSQIKLKFEAAELEFGETRRQIENQLNSSHEEAYLIDIITNRLFRNPYLRWRLRRIGKKIESRLHPSIQSRDRLSSQLSTFTLDPDAEISRRLRTRHDRLERLEALRSSGEFAGAVAEVEVADLLARGLSDSFHVFHDVKLQHAKGIGSKEGFRKSAQIDHIVLGKSGVFMIETKLWSSQFASKGDYYDPFQQVHWARRLCDAALKDALGQKLMIRTILATKGKLPDKPSDSYTHICPPWDVCRYILKYEGLLEDRAFENAVKFFKSRSVVD